MVTVVEVIRLAGDAFAALSLFRLLQWQLTHAASDEAHIAIAVRMGASASWQSDDAASVPVPTAALLPARVAARLAAALAADDDEIDDQ